MTSPTSRRTLLGALLAGGALAAAPSLPRTAPRPAPDHPHHPPHPAHPATRSTRTLYLGTYTSTSPGGTGIGVAAYDPAAGTITDRTVVTGVENPSYLALHPSGGTLYAVDEQQNGGVTAVALADDGTFRVLGTQSTGGAGPCHLSVHPGGRWLFSANYTSGSVAVHSLAEDGSVGERTDLVAHSSPAPGPGQDGPHAHQIVTAPDGDHILAVDLGNDTVYTYRLDETEGTLEQVSYAALRPGAGPRHLTFHPDGRHAYLACELDNTAVVCGYDPATGVLTPGAPQSTGTGSGTSYPAQFLVTADGRFAYLANRGHNSITRYAIEDGGAALTLIDTVPVGGDFPRHTAFSPDGTLLLAANQKSGTVTTFRVDTSSGALTPAGTPFAAPAAVCVLPV
ncbi:6-phosphogluconolactonase (cycloisomerase 2 family) [Streptomyces sp. KhCrAH-43]|uniref:lactonase family protein n=1 Tax=unclassified Streptomyces TaxID=2593676 RepID=UPI00037B56BC|nr:MULTISPECIES: lactonase family protein [unclassified Streptomyces]MYS39275.1 beta-propeller fold lactonase family protein [Streptomyces sp. SID4920]MYX69590.1 beta-propeller fold lactonase family protein [Streptomyces sp. SID8373]RAJ59525.1 6-phosphogluconolactonase (cycloisomerase 2 family) [Streptomyces sp. KhCrAH-43]